MKILGSKKKALEAELLEKIEKLSSKDDAIYYKSQLEPKKNVYGYGKYLQLLECIVGLLAGGLGKRNSTETIVKTARIKVL